jgi:bacillithiol biosynthesis cysteine-adding enzyme BshC
MDAHCINYSDTGFFSKTILQYLDNDPELQPFYNNRPDLEGFATQIKNKAPLPHRLALVHILQEQYRTMADAGFSVADAVLDNLELLRNDNTFTITTGHQLNIFTGPLYFIYKIATAIKLARQLKAAHPEKDFVPVYWMASEDHDFAEINHTNAGGKKIAWQMDAKGATGRLSTKTIREALNQYKGILGLAGNAPELSELVETAYSKFDKLANATRYLVNELFSRYGLIIIDADDANLKQQFADVMEHDIIGQHSFKNISNSNTALQKLGAHIQVNPREINFFYLADELRERIVFENDVYEVLGTDIKFTEAELRTEIQEHAERFSPNVVMRPLYQETILPNLAYIGGGGELAYWFQLKANFDYYAVDFPILILRNSALIVDDRSAEKWRKTGFEITDLFKPADMLKNEWIKLNSKADLSISKEWAELQAIFDGLKHRAKKIDPTLEPSTEAIQARLKHAIDNLERKMLKAEKRKHDVSLSHIDQMKNTLFPNGSLQERSENIALFYVAYGPKLINDLVEKFEPLEFKFTMLVE